MGVKFHFCGPLSFKKNGRLILCESSICVYCNQLIPCGQFFLHARDCPSRTLPNLTVNQKRVEIILYIFNLVPQIREPTTERKYFLDRDIDFEKDSSLFGFTLEVYRRLEDLKDERDIRGCFEEQILSTTFEKLKFALLNEKLVLINSFNKALNRIYGDLSWMEQLNEIHYSLFDPKDPKE